MSHIERFTIKGSHKFIDVRTGKVVDDVAKILSSFNKCFSSSVKPVKDVLAVKQSAEFFEVTIRDEKNQILMTKVKFNELDKTFACRDYDPEKIIPAILSDASCSYYFIVKSHPYYFEEKDVVDDFDEDDIDPQEITIQYEDEGIPPLTEADVDEINNLFSAPMQQNSPCNILKKMMESDEKIDDSDISMPIKPIHKLYRSHSVTNLQDQLDQFIEHRKSLTGRTFAVEYEIPQKDIIPVIDEREDNIHNPPQPGIIPTSLF